MNLFFGKPLPAPFVTEGWPRPREGRPYHGGLDLRAPVGTPVYAASSGTVVKQGPYSDTPGLAVELAHGDGALTRYLHLSRADVKTGQKVSKGQQLGLTGFASSAHLHFDTWVLPSKLYEYVQKFGTPTTGFTVTQGFGGTTYVKVPSEPLAPMSYRDDVIAAAKKFNVKLYSPWRNPMVLLVAAGVLGAAAWYFGKRRTAAASAPALPPAIG